MPKLTYTYVARFSGKSQSTKVITKVLRSTKKSVERSRATYLFFREEEEKIPALQLEDSPKPPKNSGKGEEGQGQPAARGQAPGSRKAQAGQVERGREEGQAGRRAARRLPVEIMDALSADSPLEHIDGRGGPIFSRARGNA